MSARFVVAVDGLPDLDDDPAPPATLVTPSAYVVLDLDAPCDLRVVTRHPWDDRGHRAAVADVREAS